MKYIELVLATFASLALAAPQNTFVKPTMDERQGDVPMTLQRVLDIYEGYSIHCDQFEPNKLSCSAPWNRGDIKKSPNAVNQLSPLCKEKGGCTSCSYDKYSFKNADYFTCEYETPISEDCPTQMSQMFHACRKEKDSTFMDCKAKVDEFGRNGCKSKQ